MTNEKVIELRKRAQGGEYFRDLAVEFGISPTTANAIIIGRTWRHVWPYDQDNPPTREVRSRNRKRSATG